MSDERDSDNPWANLPDAEKLAKSVIDRDNTFWSNTLYDADDGLPNGEAIISPEITQNEDQ